MASGRMREGASTQYAAQGRLLLLLLLLMHTLSMPNVIRMDIMAMGNRMGTPPLYSSVTNTTFMTCNAQYRMDV